MKKLITLSSIILAFTASSAQAQLTGTTNVHVQLTDAMSILVNNSDVNIPFQTASDYNNGVSIPQSGHLTVTSNKPYSIGVSAAGNLNPAGTGNLDILTPGVVFVEIPATGNNTQLGGTLSPVNGLTTGAPVSLISGATPVAAQSVDVTYSVPSSVSKTNQILGKKADTYTTIVTYTITQ